MKDLENVLEDRQVVIARELTKIHEEFIRGTITEVIAKYKEPKGEHIILIAGNEIEEQTSENLNEDMTEEELFSLYMEQGMSKNEAIKKIAKDKGVNKNEIYQLFINK